MRNYILRRFLISVPILFFVTMIGYAIYNMASGDPVSAMIDPMSSAGGKEYLDNLRETLGLNSPWIVRYFIWLKELFKGNMGYSYLSGLPVGILIREHLPATLQLTFMSAFFSILIGIPLGIVSALKKNTKLDYILSFISFGGVSVPNFFLGIAVLYIFSLKLGWFPSFGLGDPDQMWSLDRLKHIILPSIVLGFSGLATYMRYMRSSLMAILGQPYILAARGKGLFERVVITRHAFRNALLPIITIVGLQIPGLFGGSVVVEHIFNWPGMGQLILRAVLQRDYTMLMGALLVTAIIIFVSNLVTDIAYSIVDPRIRYR